MKIMIVTDMHGQNPVHDIKREIKQRGIEKLVCLGDYDTPEILRDIRKLRIPKVLLAGNHEVHYVYDLGISSSRMTMSAPDYSDLWRDNPKEKKFIKKAIAGKLKNARGLVEDKARGRKIVYSHAGLVEAQVSDPYTTGYFWQRLDNERAVAFSFAKMIQEKYWVFFRGHDPHRNILSMDKQKNIDCPVGLRLTLQPDKRYIVTVGEYYHQHYLIFDSKKGTIEFRYGTPAPEKKREENNLPF